MLDRVRYSQGIVIAGIIVVGIVVHLGVFEDLAGAGGARFFRRQSEAYVMAALIPLFWVLFARDGHPSSLSGDVPRNRFNIGYFGWWFGLLALALLAFEAGIGLSVRVQTLKEGVVAVGVVSAYLWWSRGIGPGSGPWRLGAPIRSRLSRLAYYLLVVVALVVSYQTVGDGNMFHSVVEVLDLYAEGLGAALLVPLYFDLAARHLGRAARMVWYGALILVPAVLSLDLGWGFAAGIVAWISQMTEAFIAAAIISFFFDVIRRPQAVGISDAAAPLRDPQHL